MCYNKSATTAVAAATVTSSKKPRVPTNIQPGKIAQKRRTCTSGTQQYVYEKRQVQLPVENDDDDAAAMWGEYDGLNSEVKKIQPLQTYLQQNKNLIGKNMKQIFQMGRKIFEEHFKELTPTNSEDSPELLTLYSCYVQEQWKFNSKILVGETINTHSMQTKW